MKKIIFVFTPILLCSVILFCTITPAVVMSEDISNRVFRLHVLANSNSNDDQNLKLCVKDDILELLKDDYKKCKNVEEAIKVSKNCIRKIKKTAENTVKTNGYNYNIKATVTKEYFNTRKYDGFTLPAGFYNCLKIVIGKGEGHNWWCVMFPSVCISGCTDDFEGYITDDEKRMITSNGYTVKFKAVEMIEKIKNRKKLK